MVYREIASFADRVLMIDVFSLHTLFGVFKILNTRARLYTSLRAVHPSCHSKLALSLNFPNYSVTSCHFPSPAQK